MKKWLFLLRSFFPSWKFFDDVGPELALEVRYGLNEASLSAWKNCLPPIPRSVPNLLLNSKATYLHACHNHLNHFNSDILATDSNDPEQLTEKATYKITRNMARFQIEELKLARPPFVFQFRLSANYMKALNRDADHILISSIYES